MRYLFILFCGIILTSCSKDKPVLDTVLASKNDTIKDVIKNAEAYEVQILFSEVQRDNDSIVFIDSQFNVNDNSYFYPASTVKFPTAIFALEKAKTLQQVGIDINMFTPYIVGNETEHTTLANDIVKVFAVSDNDAFNHMYEFLGRDGINDGFENHNLGPAQINHRLSVSNSAADSTKHIKFYDGSVVEDFQTQKAKMDSPVKKLQLDGLLKGKGFIKDGELINEPMDFSTKNHVSLTALHNTLKRLMFPEAFPQEEQFNLLIKDRQYLIDAMAFKPREVSYDEDEYPDSYVKFFMFGDSEDRIPDHIKIYNKVGYAYGYLTDCAYIVDTKNKVEFILSATIHVNKNGIFNDDTYEYETIGIPFLAKLGREIHREMISR